MNALEKIRRWFGRRHFRWRNITMFTSANRRKITFTVTNDRNRGSAGSVSPDRTNRGTHPSLTPASTARTTCRNRSNDLGFEVAAPRGKSNKQPLKRQEDPTMPASYGQVEQARL